MQLFVINANKTNYGTARVVFRMFKRVNLYMRFHTWAVDINEIFEIKY